MIVNKNEQDNETEKTVQSYEYDRSSLDKNKNGQLKNKRANNILDKEIGSLRSIFVRVKVFFKDIYCYMRSFFTKKKIDEVRAIFSFKKVLKESKQNSKSITPNSENEKNITRH